MTWAAPMAALLVIIAAAMATDRATVDRAHRPLAAVLCLAMLEPLRPDQGTAAHVLCLAMPAISAWLAVRVLVGLRLLAACCGAAVFALGASRVAPWEQALLHAAALSLLMQGAAVLFALRRSPLRLTSRCAVVLAFGDLAALLGPLGQRSAPDVQRATWWIVQWQAAAVAAVLCVLHVAQALTDRRRDA